MRSRGRTIPEVQNAGLTPRRCLHAAVVATSLGSISDPHQQHLLRGHDMEISALAVSSSGALIATGDDLSQFPTDGKHL